MIQPDDEKQNRWPSYIWPYEITTRKFNPERKPESMEAEGKDVFVKRESDTTIES